MTDHKHNDKRHDKGYDKPGDKRPVVVEFDRSKSAASAADDSPDFGDLRKPDGVVEDAPAISGEQLVRLQAERDDLKQTLVQRQADFENYRKRIERERQEESRRGVGRLIEELLPVMDAFDRALKAHDTPDYEEHRKGMEIIYRQIWDLLARYGLERITAAGKIFDPHFHQAIERVETSEHPDGTILEVFQEGYLYHGRVLRPSIVRVAVS